MFYEKSDDLQTIVTRNCIKGRELRNIFYFLEGSKVSVPITKRPKKRNLQPAISKSISHWCNKVTEHTVVGLVTA